MFKTLSSALSLSLLICSLSVTSAAQEHSGSTDEAPVAKPARKKNARAQKHVGASEGEEEASDQPTYHSGRRQNVDTEQPKTRKYKYGDEELEVDPD